MDKEKVKQFFKKRENQLFSLLIGFAVLVRLYYFFKLGSQPVWWDEGDYLAIAKVWNLGMETPEWWAHFTGMRPVLLPMIWAVFFRLGASELVLRFFTLLLPSIGGVYVVYLLGKELYNKYVGLMAGTMMSVYWVWFFYSFRLLTDIPATFLGLLSFYFFWLYAKKDKPLGLYLCILFGVLGFSTRFPIALVPMSCAIYLLFVKKFKVLKDKTIWKSVGLLFILMIPYIVYFISTKFFLFQFYFGESAVSIKNAIAWNIFGMSMGLIHTIWLVAFIIGLITMVPLILGFDIFWKQKDKSLNADFFVMIWLILHYFFYIVIFRAANDRWLLMLMPAIFLIASKGMQASYNFVKKYSKTLGIILALVLLLGGAYQNFNHATELTESKMTSYEGVKQAGLWLKANTPEGAKIITASIVQNQYYSERQSYDFYTNDSVWKECQDIYGKLSDNQTCQTLTEQAFNEKRERVQPDYFITSMFEPVFTPQWAYSYPDRNNMTPVYIFPQGSQPQIVIYKV